MNAKFEKFDPKKHAKESTNGFEGNHIVVKPVSLDTVEVYEDDWGDMHNPDFCPLLDTLEAVPRTPPIQWDESRQKLYIPCDQRVQMFYPETTSFHDVCRQRIKKLGLDIKNVPDTLLASGDINCPLKGLTAFIKGGVLKEIEEPCKIYPDYQSEDSQERCEAVQTVSRNEALKLCLKVSAKRKEGHNGPVRYKRAVSTKLPWHVALVRKISGLFSRNDKNLPKIVEYHDDIDDDRRDKQKEVAAYDKIRSISIENRTMDEHLVYCILKAEDELSTVGGLNALRRMAENLRTHPEFTNDSLEMVMIYDTVLSFQGKSKSQVDQLTIRFLDGFSLMRGL